MTQPFAGTTFFQGEDLDRFYIGADPSPGQCRLLKAPNLQRWIVREGTGISGATIFPGGESITDVEFAIELWLPSQVEDWKTFAAKYFKKAVVTAPSGIDALALSISYPLLRMPPVSITKVVYEQCTELQQDEYGLWTCTLTFKKFQKPVLAPPKPKTTIPSAAVPQPTAQDAAQQTIQQQQAELQALGNRLFPGGQQQ